MDDTSRAHGALTDRNTEGVDDQLGILDGVDGSPDDPATAGIHDAAAVDLRFWGGMLRDVANSEFIQPRSGDPAFDQIITRG